MGSLTVVAGTVSLYSFTTSGSYTFSSFLFHDWLLNFGSTGHEPGIIFRTEHSVVSFLQKLDVSLMGV